LSEKILRMGCVLIVRSDVMLRLRQSLVDAEKQLSGFKLRCSEAEADLSVTKRELVTAKSDCSFYPINYPLLLRPHEINT